MTASSSALAGVIKAHDATWVRRRRFQSECSVHAFRKYALAVAQCQGVQQQVNLVHQVMLKESADELAAAGSRASPGS